jgi:hypothetical protein
LKKFFLALAVLVLFQGCQCPEAPKTAEQAVEAKQVELRDNFNLPSNATNVQYLEGDASTYYVTFNLVIGGSTRRFLRHTYFDRESTVELTR